MLTQYQHWTYDKDQFHLAQDKKALEIAVRPYTILTLQTPTQETIAQTLNYAFKNRVLDLLLSIEKVIHKQFTDLFFHHVINSQPLLKNSNLIHSTPRRVTSTTL